MAGETDMTAPEAQTAGVAQDMNAATDATKADNTIPQADKDLVARWMKRIEAAEKKWKPVFDRMRKCQQIATHGAYKEWLEGDVRYVAPILNRHINQAVAQLYAKNPQAVATARKKMLHTVWDGTQEQLVNTEALAMMGDGAAAALIPAIGQDIAQAQAAENLAEQMAKTLTILHEYEIDEQPYDFKVQLKSLVRRTKVNGVGYVDLAFVREMDGMRPETTARLEDTQAKLAEIQRRMEELIEPDSDDDLESERAQLQSMIADIQNNPDRVAREQVIYDYPRSTEILLDPNTRHLKSLLGCGWLARIHDLTCEEIEDIYKVDIKDNLEENTRAAYAMMGEKAEGERKYRVYEIQDKTLTQRLTVCRGYAGFLKRPAEPDIWLERFFSIFPLVFNEIENDEEIYPPSDVWIAKHTQFEYNRSREGLREHRVAARPYWLTQRGRLDQTTQDRLKNHAAHEIVEVNPGEPGEPLAAVVQAGPTAPIDPNLYDTGPIFDDLQRSVGSQEANLGGTSGATATESSISESSRQSTLSDNVDDLDDMLTALAMETGKVLFMHMSKERVLQIVGPGAKWPDFPVSRREAADDISMKIRAGSSGRPNQAAELANIERAWPALSQLPGINPKPLAAKYADLLEIDLSELLEQGALSIVAKNAMLSKPPAPPSGTVPAAQGPQGGGNTPAPPPPSDQGQPAFPAPVTAPGGGPAVN